VPTLPPTPALPHPPTGSQVKKPWWLHGANRFGCRHDHPHSIRQSDFAVAVNSGGAHQPSAGTVRMFAGRLGGAPPGTIATRGQATASPGWRRRLYPLPQPPVRGALPAGSRGGSYPAHQVSMVSCLETLCTAAWRFVIYRLD
jgi:hypothetical protein